MRTRARAVRKLALPTRLARKLGVLMTRLRALTSSESVRQLAKHTEQLDAMQPHVKDAIKALGQARAALLPDAPGAADIGRELVEHGLPPTELRLAVLGLVRDAEEFAQLVGGANPGLSCLDIASELKRWDTSSVRRAVGSLVRAGLLFLRPAMVPGAPARLFATAAAVAGDS